MSFFEELKRRNVVKVAVLYVVASWLVLQVVDVLSSLLPVPEWTGSLVFVLLVAGFLPVLIFSWVYELTPQGLKRERDVVRDESVTHETGRKINILIVVLLLLAISAVALDRLVPERSAVQETALPEEGEAEDVTEGPGSSELAASKFATPPDRSIAVLPFINMSPDPEQEYFSDGLSEELLNLLAKVTDLTVESRTSAFYFKGKNVTIADVAQKLDVRHILEGSVRKSGDRVRITAQLIDAQRDVHLWSETWERTLDDVFAIQEEIAASVVAALKVELLGEGPKSLATDPEAYTLYLQARHLEQQVSRDSMLQAIELFEQVLSIDPNYTPAWNGLGTAYSNLGGANILPRDEAYAKAREAIDRALAIDPNNAHAYNGLGWYYDGYAGDLEQAARYHQKAAALAPNDVQVMNGAANFLVTLGRFEDAITLFNTLVQRDPVNGKLYHNMGLAYIFARRFDEALASFDKALALSPTNETAGYFRAFADFLLDQCRSFVDRVESLSRASGNEVYRLIGHCLCYPEMNREADAAEALVSLERDFGDRYTTWVAAVHARLGRVDDAFEWLERAYSMGGSGDMSGVPHGTMFESLHDDPRWEPLLDKLGRAPEQLAEIQFQVDLPG